MNQKNNIRGKSIIISLLVLFTITLLLYNNHDVQDTLSQEIQIDILNENEIIKENNTIYEIIIQNTKKNIINITSAIHLDNNRSIISDIYKQLRELDDNWSQPIRNEEYIRVTFEKNLTSTNDITIYPRIIEGTPTINVYEEDGTDIIAIFNRIISDEYNKVFLTGMQSDKQDTFDLQILNGSLILDHVIDPTVINYTGDDTFTVPSGVSWILVEAWGAGGGGGGGTGSNGQIGAGGAGGQYAKANITVSSGQEFTITIGTGGAGGLVGANPGSSGGNTTFTNATATYVRAVGGAGGQGGGLTSSAGLGSTANAIGDVFYAGGNGADGASSASGGGGGGAGSTGRGQNASTTTAGGATIVDGGAGGDGTTGNNQDGSPGNNYGGAGGGGNRNAAGGAGAQGYLRITYEVAASAPDAPTGVSATDGSFTDRVAVSWTKSSGATGYYVMTSEDGLIATLGDVDSYNHTGAPSGSITPGTASASDGTSTEHVSLSISGQSTSNGTSRTYYVIAYNAEGNSSNSATNTGYRGVGTLSYQWFRSSADSNADYSVLSGATTASYNDATAPSNGDGRYYLAQLSADGTTSQNTTNDRGYRDLAVSPPDAPTGVTATDGTYTDRVTISWTKSTNTSGYYVMSNEDGLIASLGDVDSYNHTSAPAPSITAGTASASDGTIIEHVALSISGQSANNGATRTYYVIAYNEQGNSSNSNTDTGYRGIGTLSYQWFRSSADSNADYSLLSGATTASYNDATAPSDGSGRYYLAQLSATGASNQNTTGDRGYRALDPTPAYSNFNGSTTDFSSVPDIENVANAILENTAHGRIVWYNNVNASFMDFDSNVIISSNSINVINTNLDSSFNSPAEIRFYGLSYGETPILLKDGSPCNNPECNITSYSAGTLIANVSGFSEYTTMEQGSGNTDQVWTVTAWVNIEDTGGTQYLVQGMNLGLMLVNSSSDRIMMYLNSGENDYYAYTGTGLLAGQGWKHVAFAFRNNDSYRKIYVNGVDQTILGPDLTSTPFGLSSSFDVGVNTKGMIDELLIFNRLLYEDEIKSIYDATVNQYQHNITALESGTYEYKAYSVDEAGNYNQTDLYSVTIELDSNAPYWTNNITNETITTPKLDENIQMNLTLNDDADLATYRFSWNGTGSWSNDSLQYISGTQYNLSVTKQVGLTRNNTIGWRVYFNDSTSKTNISDIFTFKVKNTPPDTPILSYPLNDSDIYNRTPMFNWTGFDADSDSLTYNLSIYCIGGCSADNRQYDGITENEFQLEDELQFLWDDGYNYTWSVQACDQSNCSEYSENFTFTLSSLVSITFAQNNSDFGTMQLGQTNSTEDNSPNPLVIQNDGNVKINVSFYAQTPLFERAALPSPAFQARVRDAIGNYSIDTNTSWFNLDSVSNPASVLKRLNYSITVNQATLDLRVEVPLDEPSSEKTSTITAMAVMS